VVTGKEGKLSMDESAVAAAADRVWRYLGKLPTIEDRIAALWEIPCGDLPEELSFIRGLDDDSQLMLRLTCAERFDDTWGPKIRLRYGAVTKGDLTDQQFDDIWEYVFAPKEQESREGRPFQKVPQKDASKRGGHRDDGVINLFSGPLLAFLGFSLGFLLAGFLVR